MWKMGYVLKRCVRGALNLHIALHFEYDFRDIFALFLSLFNLHHLNIFDVFTSHRFVHDR